MGTVSLSLLTDLAHIDSGSEKQISVHNEHWAASWLRCAWCAWPSTIIYDQMPISTTSSDHLVSTNVTYQQNNPPWYCAPKYNFIDHFLAQLMRGKGARGASSRCHGIIDPRLTTPMSGVINKPSTQSLFTWPPQLVTGPKLTTPMSSLTTRPPSHHSHDQPS